MADQPGNDFSYSIDLGARHRLTRGIALLLVSATLAYPLAIASAAPQANFGKLLLSDAQASFVGEGDNEQAGWSLAFAGDVNADGYDDILVGAQLNDDGGQDAGKAYLIFGGPDGFQGQFDLAMADGFYVGEHGEDYAGSALSGAGDVDGDGYDDFLIGAWANDQAGGTSGKTYLYFGGPDQPGLQRLAYAPVAFSGEAAGDVAGFALAPAGDVDADGYADFLIGAPNNDAAGSNAGRVYLWLGSPNRPSKVISLKESAIILQGSKANDRFGYSLAPGRDIDPDGYADVLIGAYQSSLAGNQAGAAYFFSGDALTRGLIQASSATLIVVGAAVGDKLGSSVALLGDADGDGMGDLLVGASRASQYASGAGAAILVTGSATLTGQMLSASQGIWFFGDIPYDQVGYVVAAAGDINRDGLDDLLISAPTSDNAGSSDAGRVGFVSGSTHLAAQSFSGLSNQFLGVINSGLAGFSVGGNGDIDGDGHPDILIGAAQAGHAYLIKSGLYIDDDGDGLTEIQGDCDDSDPSSGSDRQDLPYDGIDQDCDGEDLTDVDGDGFSATQADGDDCDDDDGSVYPGALELPDGTDNDCDGLIDEETIKADDDHDGYAEVQGDCDDQNSGVHPGANEEENGEDDDCDGHIDNHLLNTDDDGDGLTELEGDCNDGDSGVYPGATELTDGVDQNCNGTVDELSTPGDADGDGYTVAEGDTDDHDATVYPGSSSSGSGSGSGSSGSGPGSGSSGSGSTGQGSGSGSSSTGSGSQGSGSGSSGSGSGSSGSGSSGSGTAGSGTGSSGSGSNGSGTGSSGSGSSGSGSGTGSSGSGTGSHGTGSNTGGSGSGGSGSGSSGTGSSGSASGSGSSSPGGGGSGSVPAGTGTGPGSTGSGSGSSSTGGSGSGSGGSGTGSSGPSSTIDPADLDHDGDGFSSAEGDTDDADPLVFPGSSTGGNAGGGNPDVDLDGDGYAPAQGDCDDLAATTYPSAVETVDGQDQDCDGLVDNHTSVFDDDGDGYSELDGDCADYDSTRYPDAIEHCDGLDGDCDGRVDEGCPGSAGDDDTSDEPGDDDATPATPSPDGDDQSGDDDETVPGGSDGDDDQPGDDDSSTITNSPGSSGSGNSGSPSGGDSSSGSDDEPVDLGDDDVPKTWGSLENGSSPSGGQVFESSSGCSCSESAVRTFGRTGVPMPLLLLLLSGSQALYSRRRRG